MRLVALKPLLYGTRRLQAGEEFDAPRHHAVPLIAVKKARDVMRAHLPPPPPELMQQVARPAEKPPVPHSSPSEDKHDDHDERDALRALAESLGIEIDRRWGAARLEEEIAKMRSAGASDEVSHDG
jgi:hypothetical protein